MAIKLKLSVTQIKIGKLIAALFWLLALAAVLLPNNIPFSSVFIGIGIFLIVTHLCEIVIYRKKLPSINNIIGVFFFGILYMQQMAINKAAENT